jgi:hypothetical protein
LGDGGGGREKGVGGTMGEWIRVTRAGAGLG